MNCKLLISTVIITIFNLNSYSLSKQLPIIGWYGIPANQSTVERFIEQRDSGITENFKTYSNQEEISKALDAAYQAGIKLYIYSPEMLTSTENFVRKFKDHPALAGYYLKDEPSANLFLDLKKLKDDIMAVDSVHTCYINLLPMYATAKQLGSADYQKYVNSFITEVNPSVLSFDYYPIISKNDSTIVLRDTWFQNLEIISKESLKHKIPFWAFVLATEHNSYPTPTLGQLKLQAFINLAYGAQGIQYFTYWTPPGNTLNKFRNGPIDSNGNKTKIYYLIKELNEQIKNLSFVFLDCKVLFTKHINGNEPERFKEINTISNKISKIETNGNQIFVSYLLNNDKYYLVLVNKSFQRRVAISIDAKASSISKISSSNSAEHIKKGRNDFFIEEGDVLVFTWNK